ncbi:uncharacterized protein PAC_07745 [Phialocephala subalpina]|uniref:F-box domain-containing protein n=1 Tax=Phialocephala subalpina TaxID=576137 RepID=A0A1L7WYL9_9HELO|nr:uncharacterized protein PAC_07745 [Phialocephala subalpina]
MGLLDLPVEILILIPNHLRNIEDFMSASSSCRTLRNAFQGTDPHQILRLAGAASRIFFHPDPYFLIAATVRQVSDWALESQENTEILRKAFMGGIEGLYDLCIEKAGLTMEDVRRLHAMRFTVLNPMSDFIDKIAGKQWYSTPNFWDGGVSDANTVACEAERALFQIIIYGELFSSTMRAHLQPELNLPRFDFHFRLDYIRYCIPDWICEMGAPGIDRPLPVGPYAPEEMKVNHLPADQIALNHVLNCRRWRESWERVRRQIGEDFQLEWKQDMWHSAVQCQGLEGLEMLRPGGVEKWRDRLTEIRNRIEKLEKMPEVYDFHPRSQQGTEYPFMANEVYILMCGLWPW